MKATLVERLTEEASDSDIPCDRVQSVIGGHSPVPSPPEDGRERGQEKATTNYRQHHCDQTCR